jgi:hypothetical protein
MINQARGRLRRIPQMPVAGAWDRNDLVVAKKRLSWKAADYG